MYKQPQGVRLPPTKYRSLEIQAASPSSSQQASESKESDEVSINTKERQVNDKITRAMYGSSRQAIMEIDESVRKERSLQALREGGFTLDCISIAAGDRDLKLPPYNPFYDPQQHLFLKSPERLTIHL